MIDCDEEITLPYFGMDERYSLKVNQDDIQITAENNAGVLRALSTFLQLIITKENEGPYVPRAEIEDEPKLKWRGLLIDVARHFQNVGAIKRNMDVSCRHFFIVDVC